MSTKKKLKSVFTDFVPKTLFNISILYKYPHKTLRQYKLNWKLRWITTLERLGFDGNQNNSISEVHADLYALMHLHESAVLNYKLKSYNGALDIMVAKEKLHFRKDTKFETWKKYGLKGVRIHLVDGNHDDMILPPNSAGFALKLQNILDKNS